MRIIEDNKTIILMRSNKFWRLGKFLHSAIFHIQIKECDEVIFKGTYIQKKNIKSDEVTNYIKIFEGDKKYESLAVNTVNKIINKPLWNNL